MIALQNYEPEKVDHKLTTMKLILFFTFVVVINGLESLNNHINSIVQRFVDAGIKVVELEAYILDTIWHNYRSLHGNSVHDNDLRKQVFNDNLLRIIKHNIKYKQGLETFELGLNKYSHL
ncbi:hypothetical protein GJ496_002837, partial [Pomphorhynchus laevis]